MAEKSQNKKSKYNYIWRLVENDNGELICIDTHIANKVIKESLIKRDIPELNYYQKTISEPQIDKGSRLDFLLKSHDDNLVLLKLNL